MALPPSLRAARSGLVAAAIAVTLCATMVGVSCSPSGSSLARDEGGAAPGGAATSSTAGSGGAAEGAGGSGGAGGDPEPAGPARLTIVNGTVDASAVRLCFVPYPSGSPSEPWPADDDLGFARGRVVDSDGGFVPADADIEVVLLAGELAPSYGKSCSEILAGPTGGGDDPWPTALSLGVLPESALRAERSLLLVTVGCVGGEDHTGELDALVCGEGYGPSTPNAGLVAAPMSRVVVEGRVGMQFVHGSLAMPKADLRVRAGDAAANAFTAVQSWTVGAIAPYPPLVHYSLASLGVVGEASIEIFTTSSSTPAAVVTFADAYESSALELAGLADGEGIVFVTVGATAGLASGTWWNELRTTVVDPSPP